ncbi:TPA: FAD-dependent oxidoreductase [Serratia liquefaciens]
MQSRGHAIVIGAGIAGLTSAFVLARHFERVTLIERDSLGKGAVFRKGVPQARHAHGLTSQGALALETLFPGIGHELEQAGAPVFDHGESISTWISAGHIPFSRVGLQIQICTRPLLETCIRQRVMDIVGIECIDEHEVVQLHMTGPYTSGVYIRACPAPHNTADRLLPADWVVDASGRFSHMPQWLEKLGYDPPKNNVVDAHVVYASCTFKAPSPAWRVLYHLSSVPDQPRGVYALCTERDEWLVTLYGAAGDKPGLDESAFRAFAASLDNPDLNALLLNARRVSSITRYARTENRRRAYGRMCRWPEHLVVIGDAACAFNPIYGQGMTLAVKQSILMGEVIERSLTSKDAARQFQVKQEKMTAWPWRLAISDDLLWQAKMRQRKGPLLARIFHAYKAILYRAVLSEPFLYKLFLGISHQVHHPLCMFHPQVLIRVVKQLLRHGNR